MDGGGENPLASIGDPSAILNTRYKGSHPWAPYEHPPKHVRAPCKLLTDGRIFD